MKKITLFLIGALCSINLKSQEKSILLKQEFKPNSKYEMIIKTSVNGEMEFIGDEEFKKVLEKQLGSDKMLMKSNNEISISINTSDKKGNETPFVWEYDIKENSSSINGRELPQKSKDALKNLEIIGKYINDNEMNIEDIRSESMDESMRAMLKDMLKEMNYSVKFPTKELKIGDTFTQENPLKINIPSAGDMKFKIITNYKLTKIEDKLVYFDLIQTFTLDSDIKMINMDATGYGDGKAIFDLSQNVMKSVITDLKMKMTVEIKENIKMINNSSSHSEILTQKIK